MTRFCRFALRTTDVPAARLFYRLLLGDDDADIGPLPAEAIARGARPHWLGQLGVADVESAARAFVEKGALRTARSWAGSSRRWSISARWDATSSSPGASAVRASARWARSPDGRAFTRTGCSIFASPRSTRRWRQSGRRAAWRSTR